MPPKISIITASYNAQDTIKSTLESILQQDYKEIEHIIIDGASTDQTLTIINPYIPLYQEQNIPLKIISEKDKGIYDAMNKGIRHASGEIIGFLNSDDFFSSPHSLSHIMRAFNSQKTDCVFGQVVFIDQNGKIQRTWNGGSYSSLAFFLGWHPAHPTFYAKKDIFDRLGGFNLNYRIAADYELMLRFLQKHQISSAYIPHRLVTMRLGGASNASPLNILQANLECFRAWRENQLSIFPIFILFKPLRKAINALIQKLKPQHKK